MPSLDDWCANLNAMTAGLACVDIVRAFGGTARWGQLKGRVSRRQLRRSVADGTLVHDNGTYSLPRTEYATRLARRLRGVRSHRSAAEHWRFALPPTGDKRDRHDIAVASNQARRNVPDVVHLRYLKLLEDDVIDGVLTPVATVAFCLRDLTLREALSVGDSALASGQLTREEIAKRVALFKGPGRTVALLRVGMLSAKAANAFESSARAILIEAGIAGFETQVDIRHKGLWIGRVDLAHRTLMIIIECDGFGTHGTLEAMTRDATRHTWLVSAGWRTLRFTWYQVMFQPQWVLGRVKDTIEVAQAAQPGARKTAQRAEAVDEAAA